LLDNFHRRVTEDMYRRAEEIGMNMYDVLKVASLIEKEAGSNDERTLIASVIYNRLNAGIVLGIDASILYPYNDHEGAPTMEMLEKDDPYNTRIHDGLPPTPICSPGLASIYAALYPESTNYYFYALDADAGVHRFFTNDTEFNNFVASQNYA
ncbi:MAG: endolytic transglycosylase MltG, partial [Oscillospiraceae bacterium]|nr:endolytic transglycosylase MltG [Oscillospiraceae bacterium]